MQPPTCSAVHPGSQPPFGLLTIVNVVSFLRSSGARLAARSTAWYSGSPNCDAPALAPPVAVASVGAGLPDGPITFGSQS